MLRESVRIGQVMTVVVVGDRGKSRGRKRVLGVHRTGAGAGFAIHRARWRSSCPWATIIFLDRQDGEDKASGETGRGENWQQKEKLNGQRTAPIRRSPCLAKLGGGRELWAPALGKGTGVAVTVTDKDQGAGV